MGFFDWVRKTAQKAVEVGKKVVDKGIEVGKKGVDVITQVGIKTFKPILDPLLRPLSDLALRGINELKTQYGKIPFANQIIEVAKKIPGIKDKIEMVEGLEKTLQALSKGDWDEVAKVMAKSGLKTLLMSKLPPDIVQKIEKAEKGANLIEKIVK